jgi:hypothetical protein
MPGKVRSHRRTGSAKIAFAYTLLQRTLLRIIGYPGSSKYRPTEKETPLLLRRERAKHGRRR